MRVACINITPVKGLALQQPAEAELTQRGAEANRRFYLTQAGRLFNGKRHGPLVQIAAEAADGRLALHFPDGREVAGAWELGAPVTTDFYGRPVAGRLVLGPWSAALSEFAGTPLELVRADEPGTAVDSRVGTLVSRASCERLGRELGAHIDPRRFRMLLELEGPAAHEEDVWTRVRVGAAVVRVLGPVGRCAVTTHDPDTGVRSLDTLAAIQAYRGPGSRGTVEFGVYFAVEQPGLVRVGDPVEPLG